MPAVEGNNLLDAILVSVGFRDRWMRGEDESLWSQHHMVRDMQRRLH